MKSMFSIIDPVIFFRLRYLSAPQKTKGKKGFFLNFPLKKVCGSCIFSVEVCKELFFLCRGNEGMKRPCMENYGVSVVTAHYLHKVLENIHKGWYWYGKYTIPNSYWHYIYWPLPIVLWYPCENPEEFRNQWVSLLIFPWIKQLM